MKTRLKLTGSTKRVVSTTACNRADAPKAICSVLRFFKVKLAWFSTPSPCGGGWGGGKLRVIVSTARAPIPAFPRQGKEQEGLRRHAHYQIIAAKSLVLAACHRLFSGFIDIDGNGNRASDSVIFVWIGLFANVGHHNVKAFNDRTGYV